MSETENDAASYTIAARCRTLSDLVAESHDRPPVVDELVKQLAERADQHLPIVLAWQYARRLLEYIELLGG